MTPEKSNIGQETPETASSAKPRELTPHEKTVMELMLDTLDGIQGFPDTPRRLRNLVVAYAEFLCTEPWNPKYDVPAWKRGIIPAQWFMKHVAASCEWMPSPIVAREMYGMHFMPRDGIYAEKLPQTCRRRDSKVIED